VEWSWTTWVVSVAAVVVSGGAAWIEGNWRRRPGLAMGFADHGGMWDDLVLLPVANAVITPHLPVGPWIAIALAFATLASVLVHVHWYRGHRIAHAPEHMWPTRPHGSWLRDLSVAGWLHVLYVIGELTLLVGFLLFPMPPATILVVVAIFTVHVPIGLLQPRWFLTGRVATLREQPLLVPCLLALWGVVALKLGGWGG
jgi:hypothetical protein